MTSYRVLQDELRAMRATAALPLNKIQELLNQDTAMIFCSPAFYAQSPRLRGFTAVVTRENIEVYHSDEMLTLSGIFPFSPSSAV